MKKLLCAICGLAFIGAAFAVQGQFVYLTNSDNTIAITGYTGPGGAVTIPTNIAGRPVTSIGVEAFYHQTNVTFVTIPGSVTSIEELAFGCYSLAGVAFSFNLGSIGPSA